MIFTFIFRKVQCRRMARPQVSPWQLPCFLRFWNKPVRADVAMTGEITLRGRVLPIGGLKEKLLAAKSAGMKTVIVPEKNRRDVEELSKEITGGLELVYAGSMETVLSHAFA